VSEFPEVLKDFALDTGAPHTLISDNHNAETSEKVKKTQREHGASKEELQSQRNKIKTSVSVTFRILNVPPLSCLIAQELQISYGCLPSSTSFWCTI